MRSGGRRRRGGGDHGHSHDLSSAELAEANPTSPLIGRALAAIVVLVALAAAVSMVLLWPHGDQQRDAAGYDDERVRTEITAISRCPGESSCLQATARIHGSPEHVRLPVGAGSPSFSVGDKIVVNDPPAGSGDATAEPQHSFLDFDRTVPMVWLVTLFVVAVLLLSRWKGLTSLISLALSLLVVGSFVVPALLAGSNPLAVALTASALIMIVAIYSSQGLNLRSSVAIVGTLASLAVAGGIGAFFTDVGRFVGFSDESVKYLVAILGDVDVRGLLLAGLIIGALGVLDDVTVTQTAAVWEIAAADPTASRRSVFAAAMRIGRSHISATVNTLVLAYVGTSLPLLMLLSAIDASVKDQILSEGVAQEIVRGLAGSLGLIAAVPITTALAVAVVSLRPAASRQVQHA